MFGKSTLVMKFGGAAVATPEHFGRIADLIVSRKSFYKNIVVVTSAMGDTTDQLISLAKLVNPNPPQREYDMLVTVGERISISLLAMALARKGQEAISFTGSQSGIITSDEHTNALVVDVKPHRLQKSLKEGKVVIVAGFQGVSARGEITTLGRGGSDTSAVALAAALEGEKVEFYKDVNGIYTADPKEFFEARLMKTLTYHQALEVVSHKRSVLHPRSILLAERNNVPLHVRSFLDENHSGSYVSVCPNKRCAPIYEPVKG